MLKAKDFREQAREALKGKWKQASIAGLIAGILGGNVLYQGYATGSTANAAGENMEAFSIEVIIMALVMIVVISAVVIFIGALVGLGYAKFNLSLFESEEADYKMIFSERKRYKDCFLLYVMQFIYISIGSIFFVIPGIIAFYAYSMAPYIMVENPELSVKEAMKKSKELMKGNKWRLFCLSFSFIGWDILAALSFGIGHLVLCPYVEAAGAAFYQAIKDNR